MALAPSIAHAAIIRPAAPGRAGTPPGAQVLGALAKTTTVHASVALAPRDAPGLAAYAQAVSTPGSALYHRYLTVGRFRQRFAPSAAQVATVRASLVADGLRPGTITANGLTLPVTAAAATAERAFDTSLHRVRLPSGETGYANLASPSVDPAIAGLVQGIVGLDTVAPTAPRIEIHPVAPGAPGARANAASPASDASDASDASPASDAPAACSGARSEASNNASYTTSQIAARYHLDDLYGAGDVARGVTVAVYELEPFSSTDVAAFQSCFHATGSVSTVAVDGGAGGGSGSGEAAMDVEDVVGLAPAASVEVYEGPSTGGGAYDTYARIVSDDTAQVVTTSWGLCESYEGSDSAAAENTLFQEAAVQGQTILASSGDEGSNDCANDRQAVDDPSSQPWVTGVGATSIHSAGERAWNNSMGATGGGVSALWARPAYQTAAAQPQGSTTCGSAGDVCREVPDVSADGDPDTGYVIYYKGTWNTMGGTSISTPTWAAVAALADASPACAGHPVGFLNPALYRLASSAYAADFGDVTAGANGYESVPGYSAGPGYDMASGLGTPDAATLVPALCGDALTLAPVAGQVSVAGRALRLTLSATSSSGAAITYGAAGLPAGLSIDPSTATISGTPTTAGTVTVEVTAADTATATAQTSFAWSVSGASPATATATATSAGAPWIELTGLAGRSTAIRGRVRLAVTAHDRAGSELAYSATGLPTGLTIDALTGVITGHPSAIGRFPVTVIASDRRGRRHMSFRWLIAGRPRVTRRSLQESGGVTRLSLRISSGRLAPAITRVVVRAPRGRLRLAGSVHRSARTVGLVVLGLPAKLGHLPHTVTLAVTDAADVGTILRVRVS